MASSDIIEEIREQLGSRPIPKIDPNTQAPLAESMPTSQTVNAVIPVVLLGFYKNTRNEDDATKLMHESGNDSLLAHLFGDEKSNIIKSVAGYEKISDADVEDEMKKTVSAVKDILNKDLKNADGNSVSNFFTDQRSNILKHLPAQLNIGELLHDTSVDDRTNKMEGPMSGIMHTIEKVFSSTK